MGTIVRGKYLITDPSLDTNYIKTDYAVYIEVDKIVAIDDYYKLTQQYPQANIIGNGQQLVMPGLIDAHSHGRGLSPIQKGVLNDYLENNLLDWAFMPVFSPELTSLMCSIRHIQNGCTTIHNNGFDIEGPEAVEHATRTIDAYLQSGIRLAYSPGVRNIDRLILDSKEFLKTLPQDLYEFYKPVVEQDSKAIENHYFEVFHTIYDKYHNNDTSIFLSPSWAQACTSEFLQRAKQVSIDMGGLPIHMHCVQTPIQKNFSLRKYGKTAIRYLHELELLGANTTLAHAIWVTAEDIDILAATATSITTHPSCNLAMRNGLAPVYAMHQKGINIAMGMDDKTINDDEDAIMEMRMLHKLHRIPTFDLTCPALSAREILQMATGNAAKVLGFSKITGALRIGMKADIIMVDLDNIINNPCVTSELDILELLIHRGMGRDVHTVFINGQLIMQDRKILSLDVANIYDQVREAAKCGLSAQQLENAKRLQRLKPYYQKWYNAWLNSQETNMYKMHSS